MPGVQGGACEMSSLWFSSALRVAPDHVLRNSDTVGVLRDYVPDAPILYDDRQGGVAGVQAVDEQRITPAFRQTCRSHPREHLRASSSGRSKLRQASCGRSWSVMVALSEYKSPGAGGQTTPRPACHPLHGAATESRLIRTWAMTWSETTRASPSLRWRILRNSSSMAEPAIAAIG